MGGWKNIILLVWTQKSLKFSKNFTKLVKNSFYDDENVEANFTLKFCEISQKCENSHLWRENAKFRKDTQQKMLQNIKKTYKTHLKSLRKRFYRYITAKLQFFCLKCRIFLYSPVFKPGRGDLATLKSMWHSK